MMRDVSEKAVDSPTSVPSPSLRHFHPDQGHCRHCVYTNTHASSHSVKRRPPRKVPWLGKKWDRIHCAVCRGKKCRVEDPAKQKRPNAIKGLNSDWVTDRILATCRPSTYKINEHGLIEQFKQQRIVAIINLQERREHAWCGDGFEEMSGFSYLPEVFMNNNIFFYNYGWPDMHIPSMSSLMDMVQVVDFTLGLDGGTGKVAIHCHAGLGRTGLLIACALLYRDPSMSPEDAVQIVRTNRPGSVQTASQVDFVDQFYRHLNQARTVFAISRENLDGTDVTETERKVRQSALTVHDQILHQRKLYHGHELFRRKYVPRILEECTVRLALCAIKHGRNEVLKQAVVDPDKELSKVIWKTKCEVNDGHWTFNDLDYNSVDHAVGYWVLLKDWLCGLASPIITLSLLKEMLAPEAKRVHAPHPHVTFYIAGLIASFMTFLTETEETSDDTVAVALAALAGALTHSSTAQVSPLVDGKAVQRLWECVSIALCMPTSKLLYKYSEDNIVAEPFPDFVVVPNPKQHLLDNRSDFHPSCCHVTCEHSSPLLSARRQIDSGEISPRSTVSETEDDEATDQVEAEDLTPDGGFKTKAHKLEYKSGTMSEAEIVGQFQAVDDMDMVFNP